MDALKNKSDFNFQAATILIDKCCYAPSVHCSYYAMLQYAKHTLMHKFGINESDFDPDKNNVKGIGTHSFIRNESAEKIKNQLIDKKTAADFSSDFGTLKRLRIEADYKNVEIDIAKARKSFEISKKLKLILQKL